MLGLTGFLGSHGFHFAFGLTQISQIPQYRFVGGKSHRCFCVWAGSHGFHFAFGLTQISQMLLRVGWLARIPLCFWAHTDLTDPTVLLCGWEISQMLLRVWTCVGSDGGTLLSLSRIYFSDPSDKSDIFKNNPLSMLISKFFVEKISPLRIFLQIHTRG